MQIWLSIPELVWIVGFSCKCISIIYGFWVRWIWKWTLVSPHENRKKWVNMYIFVTLVSLLAFANLIRARAPQTERCYHHQCSVVADLLYIYNFQGLHVNKTCGFPSRCSAEWMNEWVSGWMDVLWLHFNSQPNAIVDIYFTRICLHIHSTRDEFVYIELLLCL